MFFYPPPPKKKTQTYTMGLERYKNTCSASIRNRVQISSTHLKSQAWLLPLVIPTLGSRDAWSSLASQPRLNIRLSKRPCFKATRAGRCYERRDPTSCSSLHMLTQRLYHTLTTYTVPQTFSTPTNKEAQHHFHICRRYHHIYTHMYVYSTMP